MHRTRLDRRWIAPAVGLGVGLALVGACGRTGLRIPREEDDDTASSSTASSSSASSTGAGGEGGAPPTGVVQIALGAQHSCVRTLTGGVYCWGGNGHGQIGVDVGELALTPTKVELPRPALAVTAGTYTTCAILDDGRLFCWGENGDSEMGAGIGPDAQLPVEVVLPPNPDFNPLLTVALGEAHACAITQVAELDPPFGPVWCWGRNASGQVGIGMSGAPVAMPSYAFGTASLEVALGAFHTLSLQVETPGADIHLFAWGGNDVFQLGADDAAQVDLPTFVKDYPPGTHVRSGRGNHSCVLLPFGAVECWGLNSSGQLGRSTLTQKELPGLVTSAVAYDDLALGFSHTCALDDGRVYCWGNNNQGQLGSGTTDLSAVPLPIPNLDGVQAIAAGTLHTCAFRSNDDIRCWGANAFGQLGDGTTVAKLTPVSIQLP